MIVHDLPCLTKACELLVCDNIPYWQREEIFDGLVSTPLDILTHWETAEEELKALSEDDLDEVIFGEEGAIPLSVTTQETLNFLYDKMSLL